jgi:predicted GNAT family acetyltransferase
MQIRTYTNAGDFLKDTQAALESNEAANSLMLGICGQLIRRPERISTAPCLKVVEDQSGLALAALMTPPHKLVVYGHQGDLVGGARALVEDLLAEGWQVPGVLAPSLVAQQVSDMWTKVTDRPHRLEYRQSVYKLTEVKLPVPEDGKLRPATEADIPLVTQWKIEFTMDIFGRADRKEAEQAARFRIGQRDIYLWDDGGPVSMAMKNRPTTNGISVSLVYTPSQWRCRGYGTACVGELSRMLLDSGWEFCVLFADLANPSANRVYQKIGYRPACVYDEVAFSAEGQSRTTRATRGTPSL